MKGNPDVIACLNRGLHNELVAINQYFLHARMLKDWGLTRLGQHEHDESIDEMKHADQLIERIPESEEEHVGWLETQLGLIAKVGIQNYNQSPIGKGGA